MKKAVSTELTTANIATVTGLLAETPAKPEAFSHRLPHRLWRLQWLI
jgi:hypothetical protein